MSDELLLCTRDSPSILSLSWNGVVRSGGAIPLAELEFIQDSNSGIGKTLY